MYTTWIILASYPGLLTSVFVAFSTNTGKVWKKSSQAVMYLDVRWTSGGVASDPV